MEDAHFPCFFRNNNRQGVGQAGDPRGRPVPAPKAEGNFDIVPGCIEVTTGRQNHPVLPYDEGPVNRRKFFHRFFETRVENIAFSFGIALEGIDDHGMRVFQNVFMLPHHKNGPRRFSAFSSLGGKLEGKGQDRVENLGHDDLGEDRQVGGRNDLEFLPKFKNEEIVEDLRLRDAREADPFISFLDDVPGQGVDDGHLDLVDSAQGNVRYTEDLVEDGGGFLKRDVIPDCKNQLDLFFLNDFCQGLEVVNHVAAEKDAL